MLKNILSISGRPGLYKLISYGKNVLIVESLVDNKRSTAHSRDKIISLGDIAIYTYGEDIPLGKVLDSIYVAHKGEQIDAAQYKTPEALDAFFKEALPDYDEDRVYKSDIKKVISWYNILVGAGFDKFATEEDAPEQTEDAEKSVEE